MSLAHDTYSGEITRLLPDCRQVGGTLVLMMTLISNIHSHLHSRFALLACLSCIFCPTPTQPTPTLLYFGCSPTQVLVHFFSFAQHALAALPCVRSGHNQLLQNMRTYKQRRNDDRSALLLRR